MRKGLIHSLVGAAVGLAALLALTVGPAAAVGGEYAPHPIYMADANHQGASALQPPPVCCIPSPESVTGKLPVPDMVDMAYFGGHVQVAPKIYVVFWGWGQAGAFDHVTPGNPTSDPDGAAARMLAFVKALGGTDWAGVQTQYYETDNGTNVNITNPANQFGGVWYDNTNPIHTNVTGLELAQEADRARVHFGVTDLHNSQFVIAQPQNYSEAGFNSGAGYCAWHDYTTPAGYPGVTPGISFTNMPYVLNAGSSCGQNSVNSGYFQGRLDGFTIVLGHEIEETVTDPGAEASDASGNALGGWYDLFGWENGDKCAWTGVTGVTAPNTVPGGVNTMRGNDGQLYPVQSLWSNDSAGGVGYCAGAGDDLPVTG
jgi:serine protease